MNRIFKKILYATDFSNHSQTAFKKLVDIAEASGAKTILVHIISNKALDMSAQMENGSISEIRETLKKHFIADAQKRLDLLVNLLEEKNISHESIITEGIPYLTITDIANNNDVDLIIIGSHGRSQFEEFFIGSTTEKILRKAPCPVLVVK